jgi:hypothetical protein
MALSVKKNTAYAVETEVTEGTYVAPSAASSYVQVLQDGAELTYSKEQLERNVFTGSIGKTSPRTGQFQVSGSLPVEARASSTEGSAPEFDKLMKSAMGARRQISTTTTTKASGNTATVLQIDDADISKFNVGDIVMTKGAGVYHVSPITAKSTGTGTATITLLVPHPSGDHGDSVVVSKCTTYHVADTGHPSLSISKYIEDAVLEKAMGCRVSSMSLEGFSTGQMPSFNFGFEGLNFDRSLTAIPHTPSYDTSLPPIVLDARAYMDGSALVINELTLSLENGLAFQTSIAAENGRIAGRATDRTITGTFNPYKESDSIANYTKYKNNTAFSLFAYAKVPTGTTGEFGQVVAIYAPNCIITDLGESDQDGLLQDSISFSANRGTAGTTDELYICFI